MILIKTGAQKIGERWVVLVVVIGNSSGYVVREGKRKREEEREE